MSGAKRVFTNWAGTHRCTPERWHEPASEAELAAVVKAATDAGERVRVVGAGHSWNAIVLTDAHLVSLDRMNRLIEVDTQAGTARMDGGIRLKDLIVALDAHGMALSNVGSVTEQSIAGATATGTHGSGASHGNLASRICALRLVTASGEVLALSEADGDRFLAARLGLGALGVVSELTLRVEARYELEERAFGLTFDEAVDQAATLAEQYEYVKLWWLPHTDRVQVYTYTRTQAERRPRSGLARWSDRTLLRGVFTFVLWLGARFPSWVPGLNRVVASQHFKPAVYVDRWDRLLVIAMPPVHREVEYAVPLADTAAVLREVKARIQREGLKVNFPVEVRFVAGDGSLLSPAFGEGPVAQIGCYIGESRDTEALFRGFEADVQARGARPHWGKELDCTPAYLARAFPGYERFKAVRDALDPSRTFSNVFIERLLGP